MAVPSAASKPLLSKTNTDRPTLEQFDKVAIAALSKNSRLIPFHSNLLPGMMDKYCKQNGIPANFLVMSREEFCKELATKQYVRLDPSGIIQASIIEVPDESPLRRYNSLPPAKRPSSSISVDDDILSIKRLPTSPAPTASGKPVAAPAPNRPQAQAQTQTQAQAQAQAPSATPPAASRVVAVPSSSLSVNSAEKRLLSEAEKLVTRLYRASSGSSVAAALVQTLTPNAAASSSTAAPTASAVKTNSTSLPLLPDLRPRAPVDYLALSGHRPAADLSPTVTARTPAPLPVPPPVPAPASASSRVPAPTPAPVRAPLPLPVPPSASVPTPAPASTGPATSSYVPVLTRGLSKEAAQNCPICNKEFLMTAAQMERHVDECLTEQMLREEANHSQEYLYAASLNPQSSPSSPPEHLTSAPPILPAPTFDELAPPAVLQVTRGRNKRPAKPRGRRAARLQETPVQVAPPTPAFPHAPTPAPAAPPVPIPAAGGAPEFLTYALRDDLADDQECVICCEKFLKGNAMARLDCLCIFHETCIRCWFKDHKFCPVHVK